MFLALRLLSCQSGIRGKNPAQRSERCAIPCSPGPRPACLLSTPCSPGPRLACFLSTACTPGPRPACLLSTPQSLRFVSCAASWGFRCTSWEEWGKVYLCHLSGSRNAATGFRLAGIRALAVLTSVSSWSLCLTAPWLSLTALDMSPVSLP